VASACTHVITNGHLRANKLTAALFVTVLCLDVTNGMFRCSCLEVGMDTWKDLLVCSMLTVLQTLLMCAIRL
jgi:hypothetical protein